MAPSTNLFSQSDVKSIIRCIKQLEYSTGAGASINQMQGEAIIIFSSK